MSCYRPTLFLIIALSCCLLSGGLTQAQAQSFTTLHSFGASNADGASPQAGLIQASDGNLYGTTLVGGVNGTGTLFKITLSGAITTLHSFSALPSQFPYINTDGAWPYAALIQASDGNLYGTANLGGANGNGTLFKITPSGTFTTLHTFSALSNSVNGSNSDGAEPYAPLIQASDGNLYGTAANGGANGDGTIFKMTPSGTFTTLHSFSYLIDGSAPTAALIQASDGALYGTTREGGTNAGTLFKITLSGAFTLLHSFSATDNTYTNTDGVGPFAALIQASDGNLYGTASRGGTNGNGTLFKITTSGTFTLLHIFSAESSTGTNTDGAGPGGLIQANDSTLYGPCGGGGANGSGTIYKSTLSGTLTTLYSFSALGSTGTNSDGASPTGLIQASDGNLYGTASSGGADGYGTIFAFDLGTSTAPILSSLNPGSVNAGGPAFTLTLKGADFSSTDSVHWTRGTSTNALTTTYVSATQLKASVPASLIASPGKATITVVTSSGVASNSKTFTIKVTTLKLTSATLTKTSTGAYKASINLKNIGYLSASNVTLTSASLGPASTSTPLPVSLGSLAAGATTSTSLAFPGSAGSSGTVVTLKVAGKFTGGTFSGSLKVTLP